ncbi:PadR family transcriptional regulator [Paenibacillus soyae]|nr:PadR family transcriptional regulator [Paenibacillus soyae]
MSAVRLLVLGSILRRGTSHGYAVLSDITSWHADTWTNVKPGSIYHALDKLESEGMTSSVTSDVNVKPGPSRKEYTVTKKGEIEFMALLESALVSVDLQQFSAGIAFMNMLSRQQIEALLQKRRIALETSIQFLRGLPMEELPSDPSKNPELVGIWVSYVENEAATTERILANVQAGKYEFNSKMMEGER